MKPARPPLVNLFGPTAVAAVSGSSSQAAQAPLFAPLEEPQVCRQGEWSFTTRPLRRTAHTWVLDRRSLLGCEWTLFSSRKFGDPADSDVRWTLSLEVDYPHSYSETFQRIKMCKPETVRACLSFSTDIPHKRVFYSALLRAQEQALATDADLGVDAALSDDPGAMSRADAGTRMSLGELFLMDSDKELTIRVDIVYLEDGTQEAEVGPAGLPMRVAPCSLVEDLSRLLDNPRFSDVVLSADGREWHVHKAILSARSPVFAAMFEHGMAESESNRVTIVDVGADAMGQVLRYMYTGKVDEIKSLGVEILAVADKYALNRLKTLCEEELSSNVNANNALEILVTADLYAAQALREVALQSLCSNIHQVLGSAAWQEVVLVRPQLVHHVLAKCVNYRGS